MKDKEYKTPEELIKILIERKLGFSNPIIAKRKLNEINYFTLKGYNDLLTDENGYYKNNCDFNELLYLYEFDKELKGLLLEYILDIEMKLKTSMSNLISSKYGIKEKQYLDKNNYDLTSKYLDDALNTIKIQIKTYGFKSTPVKHYKDKYGYIPFYVLSKCITIGAARKLFNNMKQIDQSIICNNLINVNYKLDRKISKVKSFMSLIANYRNKCAHDEIIYHSSIPGCYIPELKEHQILELKKNDKRNIIQGKNDLFALIICMKYFMSKTEYMHFTRRFESLLSRYLKKSLIVSRKQLLDYMNIPETYSLIITL